MPVTEWDYDNKYDIMVDGKKVKVYFQPGSSPRSALVAADLSLDEYTRSSTSAPWSKDSDSDEDFDGGRRMRQSRKRQGGSWTKRRRGATRKRSGGSRKRSGGSRKRSGA